MRRVSSHRPSRLRAASKRIRTSRVGFWLSLTWLAMTLLVILLSEVLPLQEGRDPAQTLTAPVMQSPDITSAHILGTDRQGLDVLTGVIYGARTSLAVGVGGVILGVVVGGALGLIAGYARGKYDSVLTLLSDTLLAFPPLVLLLALAAVVVPNLQTVTIILGVLSIPIFYRLARANTLTFAQRNFVFAARALGARSSRIVLRELLPSVTASVLSYAFVVIAVLIVAESSLSFLGLSIPRPEPTWGNMIAAGQNDLDRSPHLVIVPGIALFLTVLSLNQIGDWARGKWDPRARKV